MGSEFEPDTTHVVDVNGVTKEFKVEGSNESPDIPDAAAATLDDPFQLGVGDTVEIGRELMTGNTATLERTGLEVTFVEVVEDSRCPANVVCVRAGEAKILIALTIDGIELKRVTLTLVPEREGSPDVTVDEYTVSFLALDPEPGTTGAGAEPGYVATLTVKETASSEPVDVKDDSSATGQTKASDQPASFVCCAPGFALAPIESVEINVAESDPPQYFLVVVSGLPNGCVQFDDYYIERLDEINSINVQVINSVPTDPDLVCTQIYGMVETNVPLGSDFEPGNKYTVTVNDVVETFVAQ